MSGKSLRHVLSRLHDSNFFPRLRPWNVFYLRAGAAAIVLLFGALAGAEGYASVPTKFQNTLMPEPASLVAQPGAFTLDSSLTVGFTGVHDELLQQAAISALTQLENATGIELSRSFVGNPANASLQIHVHRAAEAVQTLDEDESYALSVSPGRIVLRASTDLGALHGLQTLLQLVQQQPTGYIFPDVDISDAPRFRWRGLMIDCARHFEPVPVILRTLDGMAAVKLNVFHWHLSDDQGFRIESQRFPKLQGMGSDGLYYTQEQVRQVVAYAHARGIRVVPEFDMPGHMTSWFVGYPQLASGPGTYQVQRRFGVYDFAINPTLESTYKFLDGLIGEMAGLFPDAYMHIGGDESNGSQWMANPEIRAFMRKRGIKDAAALQVYFNQRLLGILTRYHKRMVGWDEILAPGLPKDIIVQSWRGVASLSDGAKKGYQGILSAPYYLDGMKSADEHYLADPIPAGSDLTSGQRALILGGEVCMWGETISPQTIDSRIWPRTAAIAERFWSPATVQNVDDMYRRLRIMSLRLDALGLQHISGPRRMQRQLAEEINSPEFSVLTSVLEPVNGSDRADFQNPDQLTPLDQLVDAVAPDPPSKYAFALTVREFLANDAGQGQRRAGLEKLFLSWQDTAPKLEEFMRNSPRLAQYVPRARQLANLGAIGTESLHLLQSHAAAPSGWRQAELANIGKIEREKSLVRFTVLEPLRQLVLAADGQIAAPAAANGN